MEILRLRWTVSKFEWKSPDFDGLDIEVAGLCQGFVVKRLASLRPASMQVVIYPQADHSTAPVSAQSSMTLRITIIAYIVFNLVNNKPMQGMK